MQGSNHKFRMLANFLLTGRQFVCPFQTSDGTILGGEPGRTFHGPYWHMYPPRKHQFVFIGNTSQNCCFSIVMLVFCGVSHIFHQSILAHTKSKGQMRNGVNFATEGSKLFTNSVGIWNCSLQGTNISPTVTRLFPWWDMLVS